MLVSNLVNRVKGNKTLVNGSLFSIFSFINRGISFLLLLILANYIMPAEYGKLSLFNTFLSLLMYFIALSTQGFLSVSYFHPKESFKQDVSSILVITLACSCFLSIVLVLFRERIASIIKIDSYLLWVALIISFFQILWELFIDYLRVREKVKLYGAFSIGFALLSFVLSLVLVIKTDLTWVGRIVAQLICVVLCGCIGFVVFYKKRILTRNINRKGIVGVALWGIPLIPHLAATWLKQGGDRLIINEYHSVEQVGLFSFALNLTSIIIMIGTAFNSSNSVSIYKILSSDLNNKIKELRDQSRNILLIIFVCSTLVVLFGSLLVPILLPNYSASIPFFLILSVYGLLECVYYLLCNYLFYFEKTKQLMYITLTVSVIHLLLSLCLTRYSLYLTCTIYIITELTVCLLVRHESYKVLKQHYPEFTGRLFL